VIARHLPMKSLRKSDYSELVKYLIDPKDKQERVGKIDVTNCQSDKPEYAITEVLNTQAQNRRATSDRTYHLVLSFRPGENPTPDTLRAVEARVCAGLGYEEHQRVSVVHHDTDNLHVHIAINAIHPKRHTLHIPYNDHKTLGQLCDKLEQEFGLAKDNHVAQKRGAENRANDMEAHTGIESLLGYIKRECSQQMQSAQSWAELHSVMGAHGLQLRERGNGLIVVADDGTAVKASSIDRAYSKGMLETRFGAFEAAPAAPKGEPTKQYQPKPLRVRPNTVELYARFRRDQQARTEAKAAALAKSRARKTRAIEDAKRTARLKRTAIKLLPSAPLAKKILYAATSSGLKADLAAITARHTKERARIGEEHKRTAWADWLQSQAMRGDPEALEALRGRPGAKAAVATADGITKTGTIIYRLGATAVRDDGQRLAISRGADVAGLVAALQLAAERYGSAIAVTGTEAFKSRLIEAAARSGLPITFSDPALEQRRQQLLPEIANDRARSPHPDGGRATGGSAIAGRPVAPREPRAEPAGPARPAATRTAGGRKPDIGRIGRQPPPQAQHRLRGMSELGVVQFSDRSEVLLPGHVHSDLEHKGPKPDNGVRRDIPGPRAGVMTPAEKYIAERTAKRAKGLDIPPHVLADPTTHVGTLAFAGVREIDGQRLALLKRQDDILVLPIDAATAQRLTRVKIGDLLTITPTGSLRTKGRSR